jgi:hypothetical protein
VSPSKQPRHKGRFSEWLLLHHPLVWRQNPALGFGLIVAWWTFECVLVYVLRHPLLGAADGRTWSFMNFGLQMLIGMAGAFGWAWWYLRRNRFACGAIGLRRLLRGPLWIDLAIWLALALPVPAILMLTPLAGLPDDKQAPAAMFIIGFWAALVIPVCGLAPFGEWVRSSRFERFFRWVRWDLLLPPPLREQARTHETRLAITRPMLWPLQLHRYLLVALYMCGLQWALHLLAAPFGPQAAADFSVVLYPIVFLLFYRVVVQSPALSIPQLYAPAWRWVLGDALFTIAVMALVLWVSPPGLPSDDSFPLPHSGSAPALPLQGHDAGYLTARWLWAALWGVVLFQFMLLADSSGKLVLACFSVLAVGALAPVYLRPEATIALAVLWYGCAAYLAWPRHHSSQLRLETWMAILLMASATGFVLQFTLNADKDKESLAIWWDLSINMPLMFMLRLGALKVLRALTVIPKIE